MELTKTFGMSNYSRMAAVEGLNGRIPEEGRIKKTG